MNNLTPPPMFYPQDLEVSHEEKRSIRKNYNTVGIVLLAAYLLTLVVCLFCYRIFCPESTYDENNAEIVGIKEAIIGGCLPAVFSMVTFVGYCFFTRYNPNELFTVNRLKSGEIVRYALIVLMLQQVSFFSTLILSEGLYTVGLEVPSANMVLEHTPAVYAIDAFSSIILAPIGEELIYRGVVLRCTAKVSQRFAIFFSAFVFGIMHGNPYQFVLGFIVGIPLAILTIRTGSIIPSIICHMVNNLFATIPSVVEYFNPETSYLLSVLSIPVFLIIGIIVFVLEIISGGLKLPEYTLHHKKRTLPIMVTSWSIIVTMILFVADLMLSIRPIMEVPPE